VNTPATRRNVRVEGSPTVAVRGQLLRLIASDAIERRYGVALAVQNCHRATVFGPAAALAEFTSARAQLLNQRPELVD